MMPVTFSAEVHGTYDLRADLVKLQGMLPRAQMTALNRTGEDVLAAMRAQIGKAFLVRAPRFIYPPNSLPREMRATERNLTVRLSLGEGGTRDIGERRRKILEPFEDGRPKKASNIGPVAIPTSYLRPNRSNLIEPKLYPRHLVGLFDNMGAQIGTGTKARVSSRTNRRTGAVKGQAVGRYFVMGNQGDRYWGLYERQTSERLRKLWNFRERVPRDTRLNFYQVSTFTFEQRWMPNFDGAIDLILRAMRW